MKKIKFIVLSIVLCNTFLSCEKEEAIVIPQKRDYQTQYNEEIVKIENYLKTHSIFVVDNPGATDDKNVDYAVVPSLDVNSIWGTDPSVPNANVLTKLVTVGGVEHKIYYLKFRDGVGASPTLNNQIKAYYKLVLLNNESTLIQTSVVDGVNLPMNGLILGWQNILPEFKMGTITGTNQYNDFGAGVMFLPSALAYYDISTSQIPAYSPIIYNFKLFNVF
jgi:hypothetical protein